MTVTSPTPGAPLDYTPSYAATNEARFAARLIDAVIEFVIAGALFAVAPSGRPLAADFLVVVAITGYETLFLTILGATPGKLALGLTVAPVDAAGHPGPAAAFRRSFAVSLCFVVLQPGAVLALFMAGSLAASIVLSPHRRAFHDRLSGTVVVRRDAPLPVTTAAIDAWYSPEELPVFTQWGRAVGLNERRRARAARLDGSPMLVLFVVAAVIAISAWLQSRWALVWVGLGWLVVFVLDETRRVANTGTTPGHAEAGFEIVDVTTGRPPGPGRSLARALVLAPLLYVPPLQLLLAVWVNASRTNRGPHDLAGHTQVVDRHAVPRPMPAPRFAPAPGWYHPAPGGWGAPPPGWGPAGWGPPPPPPPPAPRVPPPPPAPAATPRPPADPTVGSF